MPSGLRYLVHSGGSHSQAANVARPCALAACTQVALGIAHHADLKGKFGAVQKELVNLDLHQLKGFAEGQAQLRTGMEQLAASWASPSPSDLEALVAKCFTQAGVGDLLPQV